MTDDNILELEEIDAQLNQFNTETKKTEEEIAYVNAQIAALRLELSKLQDQRTQVKQKIIRANKQRESAVRKRELDIEAAAIQRRIDEKRALAKEILEVAPWKDDAFDWQIDGAINLPERALVGDKRGMGKTLTAIMWFRFQRAKKILVCLRKEVASDFIKELGIREPNLFVYPMLGATSETRKIAAMLLNHQKEFVVVTNIESWRRSVEQTTDDILKIDYDAVILDEAHHIKTAHTGTAKGFYRLADKIPKVLELTGTPIKNRPQEMFSLLHALYPNLFETEKKFLRDYCMQIGQNKWSFSEYGLVNLVKKIKPFYLARTPEDVGRKIPPPRIIEYKLDFENHLAQKQAYKLMTERSMAELNSGKVISIVSQLAIMTRQAQTVSWPAGIVFTDPETGEKIRFDVEESVKADWATDFIQELVEEGERVVLFSRFKPVIYELKKRLLAAEVPVAVISGDEKGSNKEIFDDFDLKTAPKDPKYKVLLATYQTVGESANLNAATHMILYDRFWNPGNEDQAIGRIDRINSVTQATVHIPYVESTIDEYMAALIEEKREIIGNFKDAASMQNSLSEFLGRSLK
jgi:non-specific serine/threonine protein kinase